MTQGSRIQEIITRMQDAVPTGLQDLTLEARTELIELTEQLIASSDSREEFARFVEVRHRAIWLPQQLESVHRKTVLVTGGTGCIGSALIAQLLQHAPHRVVCLSRGQTPYEPIDRVDYIHMDIADQTRVMDTFRDVRPDTVFHLAALRDPGLAERRVGEALATNIVGSANVFEACQTFDVARLVYASTGKAVRFYTEDVYAATKKVGEYMLGRLHLPVTSAVRFTHVVDNSLILERISAWATDGVVRLHDPYVAFYVQSATEAAQMLLVAGEQKGLFTLKDLGWPIQLLDVALGFLQQKTSNAPIYFCGYEAGYGSSAHPGLYDPETAGETGPLINALESYRSSSMHLGYLNRTPLVETGRRFLTQLRVLALIRNARDVPGLDDELLRELLNDASSAILQETFEKAPADALRRIRHLADLTADEDDVEALVSDVLSHRGRLSG